MLTIALISVSLFISHVAGDCSIPPIYLDISARDVEGSSTLSYGAYINIGTPVQSLSLWPSLDLNETTVADIDYCSSPACSASSAHGLFDPSKSSSFQSAPPAQLDNPSVLTGSVSTVAETGTDILHLWGRFMTDDTAPETNIASFPLQLLSNYTSSNDPFFGPAGLVGLGPSSTVLESLYKAGKIASRSYGLFLGSGFHDVNADATNGSLTLGGYDAARFQAPVQSFALTPSDANGLLKAHVSSMTVSNDSLHPINLLNTTSTFAAYLSTSQYELTLPSYLASAIPSNFTATSDLLTANANFTITLGNNLTISFPSTWLATNPIKYSPTGPYILGAAFLSNAYLSVSYDSTPPAFYLAPAIQDAQYVNPKPLCLNIAPIPQTSPHLSFFVKNGLIGLIVGASIGGCALSILAFVLFRQWKQRRERKQVVRFVNLKRQEAGEVVELGDLHATANPKVVKMKAGQVKVVEKMEKDRGMASWETTGEVMSFDPPPRRATVLVDSKRKRKMGLKGILKVKVPEQR